MSLVPAICTQCGSQLQVDPSQEAAICPSCHTAFIVQDAITEYTTTNITNIGSVHADVLHVSDEHSADNRVKSGETFISLGEFDSAYEIFQSLISDCPYDYRSWMGMVRVRSKDYTDQDLSKDEIDYIEYLYNNAKKVADPNAQIGNVCDQYIKKVNHNLSLLAQNTQMEIDKAKSIYASKEQEHIRTIEGLRQEIEKLQYPASKVKTAITAVSVVLVVINAIDGVGKLGHNVISDMVAGLMLCAIFGFIIYKVLGNVWSRLVISKVQSLEQSIVNENLAIRDLNAELQRTMNYYNSIMQKACGTKQS